MKPGAFAHSGAQLAVVLFLSTMPAVATPEFLGNWDLAVREFGGKDYALPILDGRLSIQKNGEGYVARYDRITFTGHVQSGRLQLACMLSDKPCGSLDLALIAGRLAGTGTLLGNPIVVSGNRPAPRPLATAVHVFLPKSHYNAYAGSTAPALRIFSGDTIKTRTTDAGGRDADGVQIAPRGDALIGPVFVEGAMPGDTIAIHFDQIRTDRASAYQYDQIAGTALEADYFRNLPTGERNYTAWKIDPAKGVAAVATSNDHLANYQVPLSPMLGCVGVAPARDQVFRSEHLGAFGGNMDTREIQEGATLYLPVFAPGALLYLGDGHAAQGDGELTGHGLETSLDVQITVQVITGQSLGQPRIENPDFVMVVGTGGSLDAAFKNATTGMHRWLAGTYGLTPREIAAFMGTAVQFEIPQIVDPEYDIIAKIPKAALAQLHK